MPAGYEESAVAKPPPKLKNVSGVGPAPPPTQSELVCGMILG